MVVEFLRSGDAWPDAAMETAASYEQALERVRRRARSTSRSSTTGSGARDGLSLLREIRQRGVDTPVIVLTGRGAEEVAVEAMKAGAADYLSKANLSVEALERAIRHALALHAEERQRLAGGSGAARERRAVPRARREQLRRAAADRRGRTRHLPHAVVRAPPRVEAPSR